ncbi:hemolysin-III related family protein [Mycobacterium xenopi 4042]|uniref:Hemolysin-III related family protein n=1 Tax=Mycobacterium xenopi 4042 TaxID=1299334 RepID=X8AFR7_MYCXE|nr:hemolysin-III related family protein [Mycobacterium xenopi 4042]
MARGTRGFLDIRITVGYKHGSDLDEAGREMRASTGVRDAASGPAAAAGQFVEGAVNVLVKPRFRGWIHVHSAVVAIVAGATLVAVSWPLAGTAAGLATLTYTAAIVAMFAVSATYHRIHWNSVTARIWMRRLDHSMIFVFIAGSYTPFAVCAMPTREGQLVLWMVWGGALAGIVLKMCWPTAPRWVGVPLYLMLSWVAIWFIGPILHGAGWPRWCCSSSAGDLQPRRAVLRAALARSVADDIRLPRVLPRLHRVGGDLPLHRDVVRGLLAREPRGEQTQNRPNPAGFGRFCVCSPATAG